MGTPTEPSASLLQLAQSGDAQALSDLLEPYRETVTRFACRIVGHPEDAEDMAQEVFLLLICQIPSFRGQCSFRTWLYRVVLNACRSALRKRRAPTLKLELLTLRDPRPGPERQLLEKDFHEVVAREIRRMPPHYRDAVLLRLTEELTYAEIAEVLYIPMDTARMRIYRGMERLRDRLSTYLREEL
jgi:RNA polymerase sigma-70 factor (ECF subfamily)